MGGSRHFPRRRSPASGSARLIETPSAPSVLSKRYGTLPAEEAAGAARTIEEEAFNAAGEAAPVSPDDEGLRILQIYSKEISKRMLDSVKARSAALGEGGGSYGEGGGGGVAAAGLEPEWDLSAPPPFKLADIKAAIPKHCWVKDPWRSMGYVVRDVLVVFGMAAAAAYFNNRAVWPLYWVAQGTMFWALLVLGHDCGHGSFSNNPKLNSVVGHLPHSSILVPYHGWSVFAQ